MRNDIWNLILCNLRTSEATDADMGAMLSALNAADARLTSFATSSAWPRSGTACVA